MPEIPVHTLTDREVYDEIAVHRAARRVFRAIRRRVYEPEILPERHTYAAPYYKRRIDAAKGELDRRRRIDRDAAASRLDSGPGHLAALPRANAAIHLRRRRRRILLTR